jgi:hypothetical protein
MFPLVEFPQLVQHFGPAFERVFSPQGFIEFQRYISGLVVSENKTVEGINRLFVFESRNQSSLNRLLNESPFSLEELNQARLDLLGSLPGTQIKTKGVLSVDDTLLSHFGHHFEEIAWLYDSAQHCFVWAHNLVTIHYSDDSTDYPVLFQLWKPADLARIEAGLKAADVRLKESKQSLKTTAPVKWRQYLLGVWRRHAHKPEVAALYKANCGSPSSCLANGRQAILGRTCPSPSIAGTPSRPSAIISAIPWGWPTSAHWTATPRWSSRLARKNWARLPNVSKRSIWQQYKRELTRSSVRSRLRTKATRSATTVTAPPIASITSASIVW